MSKVFETRRYQQKTVEEFSKWVNSSSQLATIILPMGTGKTYTASQCIASSPALKTLWVAHREELIEQANQTLSSVVKWTNNIQKEMGDFRATPDADIVVGSVQTMHRDRKNIKEFVPDLIVIDEYHHYDLKNKQYHGLLEKFPKAKVLGLTATPYRFTGGDLPLGKKLVEMNIGTAIEKGYLVSITPEALRSKTSLAGVSTRAGDFAIDQLSKAVNTEDRNKLICDRVISAVKHEHRQGFVFGVDVAHAKAMAEILRKEIRVAEVYGETDKDERRDLMKRVHYGDVDVIVNNLCMTEGTDIPRFSFACISRPTKSLGLYYQMAGRPLRLFEGKKDALIIDVFDMVKTTQSRITYSDMAKTGDIDGSRRRSEAIMKEPIAEKLTNFPVVPKLKGEDRWTVDNTTWYSPAWAIDENQWVITWSKTQDVKKTDDFEFVPFKSPPSKASLQSKPVQVFHHDYGEGIAHDLVYATMNNLLVVDFGQEVTRNIPQNQLMKREPKYIKVNLPYPIRRVFYIISNDEKSKCRFISLLQNGKQFDVINDMKCDVETANEMVKSMAEADEISQIVRANAKWRERPASDKQKDVVATMMKSGKLNADIDMATLTGGDASTVMDQVKWKNVISNLFGADTKSKLIGYLKDIDDV